MSSGRIWSTEQQAIFSWFERGEGHLVVRARAGTGKTTTILEGVRRAPVDGRILVAAFNKSIAQELQKRLQDVGADHVEAKTLHALGFASLRRARRSLRVTEERTDTITRAGIDGAVQELGLTFALPREVPSLVRRLHTRLRETLPHVHTTDDALEAAVEVAYAADLYPEAETADAGWTTEAIASAALHGMVYAALDTGEIDFADMIFLPLVWGTLRATYSLVVVDEAQDMTTAQLELATGLCERSGRIAVVGDDRQAIYGFRGADSGSLDRLKAELKAVEMGLCTTYRCGKTIVAEAQRLVTDIVAAPGNVDGDVSTTSEARAKLDVQEGDFVLSRLNAPLVPYALEMFRAGKRVHIRGRDLGKSLVALVRKMRSSSLMTLSSALDRWLAKEAKKLANRGEAGEKVLERRRDQREFLAEIMDDPSIQTVQQLEQTIEALFADDGDAGSIMLSTVHRAKGLEANRVFVLRDTFRLTGPEEKNLEYVAITRAKNDLRYVTKENPNADPGPQDGGVVFPIELARLPA